jgi:prophage regulatory protein
MRRLENLNGRRVLRLPEVLGLIGVSRPTLHRWEREGRFPPRRQLGPAGGAVGWLSSDIDAWLESRPPALGTAEANAQAEAVRS